MAHLSRTDLEEALRFAALAGELPAPGDASDRALIDALWSMVDTEYASYERVDDTRHAWLTQIALPAPDWGLPADSLDGLWISPETVRTHLEHIYLKLGVNSRTAALARTGRSQPMGASLTD